MLQISIILYSEFLLNLFIMFNFILSIIMILSLFSIYKQMTKHFSYIQKFSSLYNTTITEFLVTYFFRIINVPYI